MGKSRGIETRLRRVRAIRGEADSPARRAELRSLLGDPSNLVVAEVAEIVGERGLGELAPELVGAFHRFLVDPVETDSLCRAKIAITDALNRLDADAEEVFRVGVRHVQPEPRWGGFDDTAAALRAAAAGALVRVRPRDLERLLAELLADPEKVARVGAVRALGASGSAAAIPLLRYKARIGDTEPEVTAECLAALMTADLEGSLTFVGQFLAAPTEEVAEGAALALAESRRPAALELLVAHWPRTEPSSFQNVLLLAVAITRLSAGIDFLLTVLTYGPEPTAQAALDALAIHQHNPAVRVRVSSVVATRGSTRLRRHFDEKFRTVD